MVTDQDLVYLGGNSVYQSKIQEKKETEVNGKTYLLVKRKQKENPQYAVYQS